MVRLMTSAPLALILGVSGRLGRRLAQLLATTGFDTIGITRGPASGQADAGVDHWYADLRSRSDRTGIAAAIADRARDRPGVVIVDVVLDRTGVTAMRQSLQAALDTVLLIRGTLAACGPPCTLVSASTTAVLAPWLYQTPYGLAKRRQLLANVRAGLTGSALLLPMLADQHLPTSATVQGWPIWSFDHAANQLACEVASAGIPSTEFVVRVPSQAAPSNSRGASTEHALADALVSHVRSLVTRRDSMPDHRAAARSRLLLTPRFARLPIDHHQPQAALLRRFAERNRLQIDPTGVQPALRHTSVREEFP